MKPEDIPAAEARLIAPTYARAPMVFTHGQGSYLYDADDGRYLDFAAGIAVTVLGHSDPQWAGAIADQARKLGHISNLFHSSAHVELASRLVSTSFAERIFFCNSGTEANEAAFKFARKWARTRHDGAKTEVLAFEHGFHGRTLGALSLTHNARYREPFQPLIPGVSFAPFNDLDAARRAIGPQTCAVFVEPVQGEGGVNPARPEFLAGLRELCDRHQALLVFDEVQCGLGRCGHLWAYQAFEVEPDILTAAKPLAGGLPIGAVLMRESVAGVLEVGDHGSTFAAGSMVCRAAMVVFDRVSKPEFLAAVRAKGELLQQGLRGLRSEHIVEVRGRGLLLGIELDQPVRPLMQAALARGLIVINAGERVLRICPPLTISEGEIEEGIAILGECLALLGTEQA